MPASLALTAALCWASTVNAGVAVFTPSPAESEVPALFRLEAARYRYELAPLRRADGYRVAALTFPSPITTPDPPNNTVHAEYFRPDGDGPFPAAVVLHILGADFVLSRYMAARMADRGVAALFVQLPYYGKRRPEGQRRRFLSGDIDRTALAMRQGACDVRRAAAWLRSRPEIDPRRVGVTGISLGGIVSALTAAVDPEIDRAAILLAGGGLAEVLWDMPDTEARHFRAAWTASGRTRADLERLIAPFDPLTHAERLRDCRLLFFAGLTDQVMPPRSVRRLWNAAGRPPIHWYDCGHYSAVGYLPPAIRDAADFFAEAPPNTTSATEHAKAGEQTRTETQSAQSNPKNR